VTQHNPADDTLARVLWICLTFQIYEYLGYSVYDREAAREHIIKKHDLIIFYIIFNVLLTRMRNECLQERFCYA
jgi:hypothetical protein